MQIDLEESKRKRLENKERKLQERRDRAQNWARQKETTIHYVGRQHSAGLSNQEYNSDRLRNHP